MTVEEYEGLRIALELYESREDVLLSRIGDLTDTLADLRIARKKLLAAFNNLTVEEK